MELRFDTKREEEIFREMTKDIIITEMRPELQGEAHQLIQKIIDYFKGRGF